GLLDNPLVSLSASGQVSVTVGTVEQVAADSARAVGLNATATLDLDLSLSVIAAGSATISANSTVLQLTLAESEVTRPLADAPTIATIAPDSGPVEGGQTVTIAGTGFVPGDTT